MKRWQRSPSESLWVRGGPRQRERVRLWSAPRGIDVLYLNLCSISRDRCSSPRPAGRLDKAGPPERSSADRINQRITPFSEEASRAPQPAIALINNVGKNNARTHSALRTYGEQSEMRFSAYSKRLCLRSKRRMRHKGRRSAFISRHLRVHVSPF